MITPVHKHFIVRAEIKHPPKEKDMQRISNWMFFLIKDIGMKILFGPKINYVRQEGNKGLTGFAIIETSHVALHVWEESDPALLQLDVYTCGPFQPEVVLKAIREFIPVKIQWKYLDRETDLHTVDIGQWTEDSPWPDNAHLRNG